jgi:hypothetical protein
MFTCDRGTQEQSGDVMKVAAFDGYPQPVPEPLLIWLLL